MITNELRKWNTGRLRPDHALALDGIADRIDKRHEQMQRDYQHEFDGWKYIRNTQWVELPKDADGKVIHVEDEVELLDGSNRFKAEWLEWDGEDWVVHETIGYGVYHEPSSLRHVQSDSWERIIEDARTCLMSDYKTESMPTMRWKSELDELVERCRRLAGGV